MEKEQIAYYWNRLATSVARGDLMTAAQRKSLAQEITGAAPPEDLAAAAAKLADGTLAVADVAEPLKIYAKGFDAAAYRTKLGPAPDTTRATDAKLAALMAGSE